MVVGVGVVCGRVGACVGFGVFLINSFSFSCILFLFSKVYKVEKV